MKQRGKTITLGKWGETLARKFLEHKGYTIVDTNVFIRGGEIDIICWHEKPFFGKTLCFIEVKTRTSQTRNAVQATQGKKLQKILNTAKKYCKQQDICIAQTPIQFEHISVYIGKNNHPTIVHNIIPLCKSA